MSKKQIIILIALILIAALAFGVYYFYFRPKLAEQEVGSARRQPPNLPAEK